MFFDFMLFRCWVFLRFCALLVHSELFQETGISRPSNLSTFTIRVLLVADVQMAPWLRDGHNRTSHFRYLALVHLHQDCILKSNNTMEYASPDFISHPIHAGIEYCNMQAS